MWTASFEDRTSTIVVYNTVKPPLASKQEFTVFTAFTAMVTMFLTHNLQEFTKYEWMTEVIMPAVK